MQEALTWDADGEVPLGGYGDTVWSMRLSLLEVSLPSLLRLSATSSVWSSTVPTLQLELCLVIFSRGPSGLC